jgi:hypothetical protein
MRSAVAALVLAASVAGAQTPRAYSYDFRLDPGGKKSDKVIHGTVKVSGGRARIETDDHDGKSDGRDYILLADAGRTVIVVHTDKRTYEEQDADEFARVVGTAMRAVGPVLKLTVKDARLDSARLGAGEQVAGCNTQRVQLRQRWTTSMRVMGFVKEDMQGSSVAEFWSDPSMPLMRNPIFDIVSTSLLALAAADEDFLESGEKARDRLVRGAPLKADVRFTMSGGDGDDMTRLRYEVTKITPGPQNEAEMMIPKGYTRSSERSFKM